MRISVLVSPSADHLQPLFKCSLSTVPVLPFGAAPTRTQFVNDSSYSRVFAALGAGARAQGRAHIPELQLKVGHTIVGRIWP